MSFEDDLGDMSSVPEKYPLFQWVFSPKGRHGRATFVTLFFLLVAVLAPIRSWSYIKLLAFANQYGFFSKLYWDMRSGHYASIVWLFAYGLIVVWTIKRLHDMNSKWYWGFVWAIPFVGAISMFSMLALSKSFEGINEQGKSEYFRKVVDTTPSNDPLV